MKENIIESGLLKDFTIKCLMNENEENVLAYWEQAKDIEEFKHLVLADKSLMYSQGYAMLSKETENHWYRVRQMFGDNCFKTESDMGGVKVMSRNRELSVIIPNGLGDGTTRCAIFDNRDEFNSDMMKYSGTMLQGKFDIAYYDCGETAGKSLDGKYQVYYYEGLVAFVKCD